jgi:hypothetical protein
MPDKGQKETKFSGGQPTTDADARAEFERLKGEILKARLSEKELAEIQELLKREQADKAKK